MSKFSVDFNKLEDKLLKRSYRLSEVKDQLETVAFDIVRFKDNDRGAALWQVQSAGDGDYIVTLYQEDGDVKKTASADSWEVVLSKVGKTLSFYYKGDPIAKMASKSLGILDNELPMVERYLPKKLAENKKLVAALLSGLSNTAKKEVLNKYPELLQ